MTILPKDNVISLAVFCVTLLAGCGVTEQTAASSDCANQIQLDKHGNKCPLGTWCMNCRQPESCKLEGDIHQITAYCDSAYVDGDSRTVTANCLPGARVDNFDALLVCRPQTEGGQCKNDSQCQDPLVCLSSGTCGYPM